MNPRPPRRSRHPAAFLAEPPALAGLLLLALAGAAVGWRVGHLAGAAPGAALGLLLAAALAVLVERLPVAQRLAPGPGPYTALPAPRRHPGNG
jgi:hypothetical protein